MFASLAVLVIVLAATALVYAKARERLAIPGALRSRRGGGADAGSGAHGRRGHDADGDSGSDD